MRKLTLVRGARQLLTLRGASGPRRGADLQNLGLIQDGAVLIADGRIVEVGPSRRIENLALARQADELDATGRVVMPGFVDSHTHLVAGPVRIPEFDARPSEPATEPIPNAGGGILALARAIQEFSLHGLEAHARHAVLQAVRHGTTTLEAKSGFGLTEANELKILRVHSALDNRPLPLVSTFLCAEISPDFRGAPDEYLDAVCSRLLPLLKRRKLAEFVDIRCHPAAFSLEQARRYLIAARRLGFDIKIHAGPRSQPGVIPLAVEMDITSLDHIVDASPEAAALLAQSNTIATLLPGATFYRNAEPYAPARTLIDCGAAVALATGYHPEASPSQNMQMAIALACGRMKMTAAEAITAATFNAACALRRSAGIGSLEPGKYADLLILDVADYREIPYHFGVNLVDVVMRSGDLLVERSEVRCPAR